MRPCCACRYSPPSPDVCQEVRDACFDSVLAEKAWTDTHTHTHTHARAARTDRRGCADSPSVCVCVCARVRGPTDGHTHTYTHTHTERERERGGEEGGRERERSLVGHLSAVCQQTHHRAGQNEHLAPGGSYRGRGTRSCCACRYSPPSPDVCQEARDARFDSGLAEKARTL
jgi:hypothetical protein